MIDGFEPVCCSLDPLMSSKPLIPDSLEERRALSIEFCHFSPKFLTRFDPVSAEPSKQVLWRHKSASQTFGTLKLRRNGQLLICSLTMTLNILLSATLKILVDCNIKQTYIEI